MHNKTNQIAFRFVGLQVNVKIAVYFIQVCVLHAPEENQFKLEIGLRIIHRNFANLL